MPISFSSPWLRRIAVAVNAATVLASTPAHAELWSKWTQVHGSGALVHRVVAIDGPVIELELHTGAMVQIRQGARDAIEIDADDNVAPLIQVHRDGSAYVIDDRRHFASDHARVTVTVTHLAEMSANGSSAIAAEGLIAPSLSVRLSGSSAVRLTGVTAERIDLHTGGSSTVSLQGICNDLGLHLGGSTTIEAARLEARRVTLQAGGSSAVTVWAKQSLTGAAGGSSDVRYYGPAVAGISTGGSSSVQRLGDAP